MLGLRQQRLGQRGSVHCGGRGRNGVAGQRFVRELRPLELRLHLKFEKNPCAYIHTTTLTQNAVLAKKLAFAFASAAAAASASGAVLAAPAGVAGLDNRRAAATGVGKGRKQVGKESCVQTRAAALYGQRARSPCVPCCNSCSSSRSSAWKTVNSYQIP